MERRIKGEDAKMEEEGECSRCTYAGESSLKRRNSRRLTLSASVRIHLFLPLSRIRSVVLVLTWSLSLTAEWRFLPPLADHLTGGGPLISSASNLLEGIIRDNFI